MIPVEQTIAHPVNGNCFEAALASILEVPLDAIPVWEGDLGFAEYKPRLQEWLATLGLFAYPLPAIPDPRPLSELGLPDVPILVGVRTPREWNHALVVRGTEVIWDPWQHGDPAVGIAGWPDPLVDYVFLLVPLDPARVSLSREEAIRLLEIADIHVRTQTVLPSTAAAIEELRSQIPISAYRDHVEGPEETPRPTGELSL